MILDNFRDGWKRVFQPKLDILYKYFSDITVESAVRYRGMLRIKLRSLDNDTQFILDSVTYKIERESVKTCEGCGTHTGIRILHDSRLPEVMCLCWKCYAFEISSLDDHNRLNRVEREST
jgi:hypothetical protein